MALERIQVTAERHAANGASKGLFCLGDAAERMEALLGEYEGRIKLIYMDPPFMTGDRFYMRVRVGEKEWRGAKGSYVVESFSDRCTRDEYLAMMRRTLELSRRLLSDQGMIFVHLDYRAHPHVRLLMDEIFGEENFLNEIVWVYQSGGRSIHHFSRKHDVILFYRKGEDYDFNIEAVKAPRTAPRTSHMRRHVDPDGRVYRSIRSNGRVYTYYDDDPVAPTDVWQDLPHLQQKDPERTGFDVQKPLALLDRIVKCASRPGDWVLDPFAGSATTLEAARRNGRNFIGIDRSPLTLNIARRRLAGSDYSLLLPEDENKPTSVCNASVRAGIGFYHVFLEDFSVELPGLPEFNDPLDVVDNWSVGYLRPEGYAVMAEFARNRRDGALQRELAVPAYAGELALCVSDITGGSHYFALPR